jgi:hypothetical protein
MHDSNIIIHNKTIYIHQCAYNDDSLKKIIKFNVHIESHGESCDV